MSKSKWKEVFDKRDSRRGLRVYVHEVSGDIHVDYPKNVPEWAQKAALAIYRDLEDGGMPTKKGVPDIVKRMWGYMIAKAVKR